jgi:hypothetical protein
MRRISVLTLALALTAAPAFAQTQTTRPGVSSEPSAPNSGAGIAGQPGGKSGPAAKPSGTVGSGATTTTQNPPAQPQDTSKIQGQPGNQSGPSPK